MVTSGMDAEGRAKFDAWLSPSPPVPVDPAAEAMAQFDRIHSIESAGGEVVVG